MDYNARIVAPSAETAPVINPYIPLVFTIIGGLSSLALIMLLLKLKGR